MNALLKLGEGRSSSTRLRRPRGTSVRDNDSDLLVVGALLWLASIVRVALEFMHERVFGVEATLALIVVVLIPWLALRSRSARDAR